MARKCRAFPVLGYGFDGARAGGAPLSVLLKMHWQSLEELTRMKQWKSICRLLHQHVDELLEILQPELHSDMEQYVAWMLIDMQQNLHNPRTLNQYANRLGVTRVHLSREFTRVVGRCFRDKLTQIRLDAATEMLTKSTDRISDIATTIGFRSPSQFVSFFRQQTGTTPLAYRKSHFVKLGYD